MKACELLMVDRAGGLRWSAGGTERTLKKLNGPLNALPSHCSCAGPVLVTQVKLRTFSERQLEVHQTLWYRTAWGKTCWV